MSESEQDPKEAKALQTMRKTVTDLKQLGDKMGESRKVLASALSENEDLVNRIRNKEGSTPPAGDPNGRINAKLDAVIDLVAALTESQAIVIEMAQVQMKQGLEAMEHVMPSEDLGKAG
jgi:hypothetical protein